MADEAICPHIACTTAQCFLPRTHNAVCLQQFQRHPSRVSLGQAVSWDEDYLRSKVTSVQRAECQRLLSKADFQNYASPASVTGQQLTEITKQVAQGERLLELIGCMRPEYRGYAGSKVLSEPRLLKVQGSACYRAKINLFQMLLKASGQRLHEVKVYFQPKVN